jgi:Fic family protein
MLFSTPEPDARELAVLEEVENLKTSMRHQLNEPQRWYGPLRRLSAARAIQGSNSIEGFDAKLDDAAAIAAGEEPLDADEETRLALSGYCDAMTYVLQLADDDDFAYSAQLLKSLHFMMTSYDLHNRPGRWRAGAIYVRQEETGQIVYEGPEPEQVTQLIHELVDSLNVPGPDETRLIQAGMAHLNLVMIHPFRDGNGRMARCLQSLVLARAGVLSPVFISIEEYLGRNTLKYYDVLAAVGCGSWHPENDARPWVRFTITAHLRQARTMLTRIKETERLWVDLERLVRLQGLHERMLPPLFDATMGFRVRNATYRASLGDALEEPITEATASKDLQRLVEADLLEPHGQKRARFYTASPRVIEVRRLIVAERKQRNDADPFADRAAAD